MDFDSRRLIFGSEDGSLMLWKPSVDRKHNYCKKYRLADRRIDFVHIYEDHVSIIEGGNLNIYLIDDDNELILEHSINTGEHIYYSISYCRAQMRYSDLSLPWQALSISRG